MDTIVTTLLHMIESQKTCTYPERTQMCPEHFLRWRPKNWKSSKAKGNDNNNNNNNKDNNKNKNNNNANSDKTCFYCKKKGHVKEDCFKLKKKLEKESANSSAEQAEVVLVGMCEEVFKCKEDSYSILMKTSTLWKMISLITFI